MKLKQVFGFGAFAGLVGLASLPFLVDRWVVKPYRLRWEPAMIADARQHQLTFLPTFREDVEFLKPQLAFLHTPQLKDAGPFLNPRVSWDFPDASFKQAALYRSKKDPSIAIGTPEAARALLKKDPSLNFFDLDPSSVAQVDTAWLHELREFDHWDIDKNGPPDLFPRFSVESPTPVFDTDALKIHLLRAKGQSDEVYREALLDVLHYGKLSLSTESLVGEMVFVASLGIAQTALSKRPLATNDLNPWMGLLAERDRLKRVYWGVHQFTRPLLGSEMERVKAVYNAQTPETGVCASARDGTGLNWPMWSAMNDAIPDSMAAYQKLVSDNVVGCRLTWIKAKTPAWVKLDTESDTIYSSGRAFVLYSMAQVNEESALVSKAIHFFSRFIPYMPETRRLTAHWLLAVSVPNYVGLYQARQASLPKAPLPGDTSGDRVPAEKKSR